MIDTLTFKISTLLDKSTGTNEIYSFNGPVKFEDISTKSNIKGKVEIMKIEDGMNAALSEVEIDVEFPCEKCLKPFVETIKPGYFEKQFLFDPPGKVEDQNDLYLVEKKHMTIDLNEALRQEIILHFPINQVCSTRCKGICPTCGKDKNVESCKCKAEIEVEDTHKPFAALKNLLK